MILDEILALLYPTSCIQCGQSGPTICPRCEGELSTSRSIFALSGVPLYTALHYNEAAAHLILAAKEDNDRSAAKYLAGLIAMRFGRLHRENPFEQYLLIPVPSSRAADYRRGFAHTVLLSKLAAEEIAREHGVQAEVRPILMPARKVADQSRLNARERAINLDHAFQVKKGWRGPLSEGMREGIGIIVVDDLVTTGSTISEAIRALREAHYEPIALLSACVAGRFLTNKIARY
jgi:ComF family protein